MPYNFKADRGKREERNISIGAGFILIAMLLVSFFLGYTLANLERSFYDEGNNEIDGFSIFNQILLSSSTHTFIPTAEAYPYSYYNPYHTYYTQYDNYDRGYYDRPASQVEYGFALYDYDERPDYWTTWEVSIDWSDPDNWSTTTGKPIIKNYGYTVTERPIIAFNDYETPIVIFTQCKYWVDTFIYGC